MDALRRLPKVLVVVDDLLLEVTGYEFLFLKTMYRISSTDGIKSIDLVLVNVTIY